MLASLSIFAALSVPVTSGDDAAVYWKGQRTAIAALPDEVPVETREAAAGWLRWTAQVDYRIDVDPSGRVLLIGPSGRSNVARQLALVRDTLAFGDEHLPSAPREPAPGEPRAPAPGSDAIPEDPEGPPESGSRSFEDALRPVETAWGAGSQALDREPIALVSLAGEKDYIALLDHLARERAYLAAWRETALQHVGFTLEEPLCGAFVLGASGMEEWDPENELVHRLAELALLRRFGRQPFWVQQGWAWHVELSLRRGIYCFPYRSGFVGVGEHGGWDKDLRAWHPAGADGVSIADVAAMRRGAWDDRAAKHAWGAIAYLDRTQRATLPAILADFRAEWDRGSRRDLGDGRWERTPDFEVALEAQAKILEHRVGSSVWTDLHAHFARGAATPNQSRR